MIQDQTLGSVYILLAVALVVSGLIARRSSMSNLLLMALAWLAIFGAGFVLFTFRDDLGYVAERLKAEATGEPVHIEDEIRIPMALDGHFWVDGMVNNERVRFLVDSGATVTTIGRKSADRAGIPADERRSQLVRTGNGVIRVAAARADRITIGPIERTGVMVHITRGDGLSVLGMNYLSTLERWGVEGRWLILDP